MHNDFISDSMVQLQNSDPTWLSNVVLRQNVFGIMRGWNDSSTPSARTETLDRACLSLVCEHVDTMQTFIAVVPLFRIEKFQPFTIFVRPYVIRPSLCVIQSLSRLAKTEGRCSTSGHLLKYRRPIMLRAQEYSLNMDVNYVPHLCEWL